MRWYIFVAGVFLVAGLIIARLFSLQILKFDYYFNLAQDQDEFYKKLFPKRGEIFIKDLSTNEYYPVAVNKKFKYVYAVPREILEGREKIAEELSYTLNIDKREILEKISKKNDPYEPIKYKIEDNVAEKISKLKLCGIHIGEKEDRYYPARNTASHIIGFVGFKGDKKIGQYGIEGYYENDLKGKQGFLKGAKDASGDIIDSITSEIKPAEDGAKLILTIDKNIQFKAEKELKEAIEKWNAKGGTIIVMEPKTGKILSMVSFPDFDPNNYNKVKDINVFLNPAISYIYEPGSVFKPFTVAGALEEKLVTPDTTYKDTGKVKIKGYIISNAEGKLYGTPTITEVLEKSINTGAVFVQRKLGKELFKKYVKKFGFSQKTGIDLQGEVAGNISNLDSNRDIDYATASFGQGIAVTPIELITAFSAIANNGKMLRPFIVEKKIFYNDREKINHPVLISQVVSTSTAETLTKMLVSVVDNGYGKKAKVNGYFIAGKTGTAQVPEKGTYSKDRTIHTFVGFAPAFNPRFAILIKLDEPKGIRFSADSCAPIFRKLAEFIFNYLKIPPQ
ncbi:penicillin-binding protein 2 [bacterium]|nr:penicillin-binding protein 2 [bacterium]